MRPLILGWPRPTRDDRLSDFLRRNPPYCISVQNLPRVIGILPRVVSSAPFDERDHASVLALHRGSRESVEGRELPSQMTDIHKTGLACPNCQQPVAMIVNIL